MDVRLAREKIIAQNLSISTRSTRPQTWYEWFWSIPAPRGPMSAEDASLNENLRTHFTQMLDHVEPPESFKPGAVAELLTDAQLKSMGYEKTEDALPAVYALAWEMRAFGHCEILRKGKVLGEDVGIEDLDGPVRIRRVEG